MKYRREIDGLRAVAVLPVILFHAGFNAFAGGFVGVDVFFVISGYLITTIILSDMRDDKFSIATFYERRARRILPVLFFVMLCCLPFAWLWLAPKHLEDFCQSLTAVSLFSSNFLFWKESGYFATTAELKPLLHTWSLAVEEQYYVLFPLFLMFLWRLRKRWIFASLLVVAGVSLALAQFGSHYYPSPTFFLLHTRCWELAIGALIAFYFLYKEHQLAVVKSNKLVNELFGFVGLALILYGIFFFDKVTPFPSLYALAPTVGTGLIIVFSAPDTVVGRLLGAKLMVGVGLISYSTYLWHQPLFVFARHQSVADPSVELLLGLSGLSLLLAYLSWRFVEIPFRNKQVFNRKKIFIFSVFGSIFFLVVGTLGAYKEGFPERYGFCDELLNSFSRSVPTEPCFGRSQIHTADDWYCELGVESVEPSYVLFGDSHVLSLFDAFNSASTAVGVSGVFAGASGCTPFLGVHALRKDQNDKNCYALNNRVFNFVVDHNIKDLYLVARWTYYTDGDHSGSGLSYIALDTEAEKNQTNSREAFEYGFKYTMAEYEKHGVRVHLIQQVPQQTIEPVQVYQQAYMFDGKGRTQVLDELSVSRDQHQQLNKYVTSVFGANPYAHIVNFDHLLCGDKHCPVGTEELSYYFDDDHLSVVGAQRLVPEIELLLRHNL